MSTDPGRGAGGGGSARQGAVAHRRDVRCDRRALRPAQPAALGRPRPLLAPPRHPGAGPHRPRAVARRLHRHRRRGRRRGAQHTGRRPGARRGLRRGDAAARPRQGRRRRVGRPRAAGARRRDRAARGRRLGRRGDHRLRHPQRAGHRRGLPRAGPRAPPGRAGRDPRVRAPQRARTEAALWLVLPEGAAAHRPPGVEPSRRLLVPAGLGGGVPVGPGLRRRAHRGGPRAGGEPAIDAGRRLSLYGPHGEPGAAAWLRGARATSPCQRQRVLDRPAAAGRLEGDR